MKTLAISIAEFLMWVIAGTLCFRIWIARCEVKKLKDGWNVKGWGDPMAPKTAIWYTFTFACVLSMFFWIPISIIFVFFQIITAIGRISIWVYRTIITPLSIPKKYRSEIEASSEEMDDALRVAIQTVNLIAPLDND